MSYSFSLLICSVIQSFIYLSILPSKLLGKKQRFDSRFCTFLFALTLLIIITNEYFFIWKTFLIVLFICLFIKFIYSIKYVIAMIISVAAYSVIFIFLQIITLIYSNIYDFNIVYIRYYPERLLQIYITLLFITIILYIILKQRFLFHEINEFAFEQKNMKIVLFYTIIMMVLMAISGSIITDEKPFNKYYIIGSSLMLIYITIGYLYLYQIKELIKSKNEYNTITNYITRVERTATQLKKQEHEHRNELVAIRSLAVEGNTTQIIELIDNINKNKIVNKTTSTVGLEKIQDTILKNLIMHKLNSMDSLGIKVELFIREKIESINISPKDITNIIGIILDNAIEATTNTSNKYISILMDNDDENDELNITIANTYEDNPTIYQSGVSTKGSMRGNGLSILADIEEQNERIRISTEITEELFIQDIFIKK